MPDTSVQYIDGPASSTAWSGGTAPAHGTYANIIDASDATGDALTLAATNTDYQNYFTFAATDFSEIPVGAIINSISITMLHQAGTQNRITTFLTLATANGTTLGTEQTFSPSGTTLNTTTVSSWGALPTRTDLLSGSFGVRFRTRRSNTSTYTVFAIKATVNYSTPQNFNQSVDVTLTLANTPVKEVGKSVPFTSSISATVASLKGYGKVVTVAVSAVPSLAAKAITKSLAFPRTLGFTQVKSVTKSLSRAISVAPTVSTIRGLLRSISFSATGSPSIAKGVSKTINRGVALLLTIESAIGPSGEAFLQTVSVTVNTATSIGKSATKTITVPVNTARNIGKQITKGINIVAGVTTTVKKAVDKVLSYDILATLRYIKGIGLSITFNINVVADVVAGLAGIISGPMHISLNTVGNPYAKTIKVIKKVRAIVKREE